jgi:hypothetical protein
MPAIDLTKRSLKAFLEIENEAKEASRKKSNNGSSSSVAHKILSYILPHRLNRNVNFILGGPTINDDKYQNIYILCCAADGSEVKEADRSGPVDTVETEDTSH